MRRALLFFAFLGTPAFAQQYVGYQGRCAIGNVHAVTQGVASANTFLGTYPGCTVTVYEAGTATPAVLYADTLGTALANPFTAATDASFLFFAAKAAYPLDVTISSAGIATPFTFASVTPSPLDGVVTDPTGDQTVVQPAGTTFTIYGNGIVTGTFQAQGGGTLNGAFGGNPTFAGNVALTGTVTLPAATPTGQQAASAAFVIGLLNSAESALNAAIAASGASAAATYLPLTGGTLSGALTLANDNPTGRQAADANYVQAQIASAGTAASTANAKTYLPLSGGTMTGPIALSSDTPTGTQAADANYVQAQIAPVAAKAATAVQQNGNATLGTLSIGHAVNSVGLQSFTATGCSITPGAVGNNCTIPVTLAVAEPDVNYRAVCNIENAPAMGNGNVTLLGLIAGKTTTGFGLSEVAGNNQAVGGGDIVCIVVHP